MRRTIIGLWILSLIAVGALATTVDAQLRQPPIPVTPRVMSGADLGFRVEGLDWAGKPVGHIVIRVNGEWVEVGGVLSTKPATTEH